MADVTSVQMTRLTGTLDGTTNLGVFEDRGEQEVTANAGKYRLGGMGGEVALGGKSTTADMTFTRGMDTLAKSQRKAIKGRVGKGWVVMTDQPLNLDEVAEGDPEVFSGRLVGYSDNGKSASGEDASTYTITVAVVTNA